MEANEGPIDRVIRVGLGVALLGIGLFVVRGLLGIALDVVGAVLVVSGALGFCHVYKVLGVCSAAKRPRSDAPSE
jgi:hypothetical protein